MLKRTVALFSAFCFLFVSMVVRLGYVSQNENMYSAKTSNKVTLEIDNSRGDFYDRNGKKLTSCTQKYVAIIKPSEKVAGELDKIFSADKIKDIVKMLKKGYPIIVELNGPAKSTENIQVITVNKRYSDKQLLAHTIGCWKNSDNKLFGLEKSFNDYLSEESTLKISYYVDAKGRLLSGDRGTLVNNNYPSKNTVKLTVDKRLQAACEKAADNSKTFKKGAIVALDVKSGEILSLVSRPNLNLNHLEKSLNDEASPFINRCFNPYTVGSVFKLAVACAAVENGVTDFEYFCTGNTNVDTLVFNCQKETGHGAMNLKSAVALSCNTYFINLARQIGCDKILEIARGFGFGESVELAQGLISVSGNLPSESALNNKGNLANFAFGQGELLATPLQIASMIASIANGGVYNEPKLVLQIGAAPYSAENVSRKVVSEGTAKKVSSFMINTVENGTGKRAKPKTGSAGGKTATAQTGIIKDDSTELLNSWFGGFYPADSPEVAIVIVNEGGTSGSGDCCPIFKEICDSMVLETAQ